MSGFFLWRGEEGYVKTTVAFLFLSTTLLALQGCAAQVAGEHIHNELPIADGMVRLAADPNTPREDLVQIIYKNRYTLYTLDHVLNDGPDPATLDLVPPNGWAMGPLNPDIAHVSSN